MVAVHEQRAGKAGSAIDQIQNESKVRKPGHNHLIDVCLHPWLKGHQKQNAAAEDGTDYSDSEC